MTAVRAMTFQEWLKSEIERRQMSYRAFANFVDIAPSTITRMLDEKEPQKPGLEVLLVLAKRTNTSLGILVEMAYPEVAAQTRISASAAVLAQRIESLPDDIRLAIESLIRRGE